MRDRLVRSTHIAEAGARALGRDLIHRALGLAARARYEFPVHKISDSELVARVRSRMGRVVSHPHAIKVTAEDGVVTLQGVVMKHEIDQLLERISGISGVKEIDNLLEVHKEADGISSLQGGRPRAVGRLNLLQRRWSPVTRLFVGSAGAGMIVSGLKRGGILGRMLSIVSGVFLARAVTNIEMRRLFGVGVGRRAIAIHKSLNIHAPHWDVFAFFGNPENFPRFLHDVRDVRPIGHGRYRWIVSGPAGIATSWNATVTRFSPWTLIAWRSDPDSLVQNAGKIRFNPNPDGSTRIDLDFSYNPPAGALGHMAAMLFGADPKSKLDEDLMQIKNVLERERPERVEKKAA